MKRPSFQFYPGDWQRDAGLRLCSVGARGCWLEMLCIMHQAEPYGHLRVNGLAINAAQLARMIGAIPKEIQVWLQELEDAGVFDREEDGGIVSRRMVRDEGVRQARAAGGKEGAEHGFKGAEHGKKGGRPRKGTGDKKPPLDPPPSSSSSSSPSGNTEEPGGSSAAEAATPSASVEGLTPAAALFQVAVPWLVARGMKDASARSLLGAAKKQLGDEGAWDLASECMRGEVMDPAPWLAAALNDRIARGGYNRRPGSGMPPTGMNRQEALEARNVEAAERAARMIQ